MMDDAIEVGLHMEVSMAVQFAHRFMAEGTPLAQWGS